MAEVTRIQNGMREEIALGWEIGGGQSAWLHSVRLRRSHGRLLLRPSEHRDCDQ
jgi:hypothetical protein